MWKFLKLVKNALSHWDKTISETNSETVLSSCWVALSDVYQMSQIVIKWSFLVREENKSVSWLIGGVLQKIWQCLEFDPLSLIRLKCVSMVRIGGKLNRCVKLFPKLLICSFPLKHHKSNRISSIRQAVVKISQTREKCFISLR